MKSDLSDFNMRIRGLLERSDLVLRKSEESRAETELLLEDSSRNKKISGCAQSILSGWSMARLVISPFSSFANLWSSKNVQKINDLADPDLAAPRGVLAYGGLKGKADKVAKSWWDMGFGAALIVAGVVGTAVAPGASGILISVGAGIMFRGSIGGRF